MKSTLVSLGDKKRYLLDQVKSYHVYIDQSMSALQKKGFVSLSTRTRVCILLIIHHMS